MHPYARAHAERIIRAVLAAADAGGAVARTWPGDLRSPCKLLAFGKASVPMAAEASRRLGAGLAAGLVVAIPEHAADSRLVGFPIAVYTADHPIPTERNVAAASAVDHFVRSCTADDTLLVLISGGGSAHLTLPAPGLSLADLADTTRLLQRAGATITELNAVRKHAELLKGGRLAAACRARRIVLLILSDVIGDLIGVIASGPFSPDPSTYSDALGVLDRHGLDAPRVRAMLVRGAAGHEPESSKPGDPAFAACEHIIVANNGTAIDAALAAARTLGYTIADVRRHVEGDAGRVGRALALSAKALQAAGGKLPAAIILGGEPTVDVGAATGVGGPSQELALSAAAALDGHEGITLLALSTDGIDGPTEAAGAVIDAGTAALARARGIDLAAAIRSHDSHAALKAAGDLVVTGPTGTNINHVAAALVYGPDTAGI